MYHVSIDLYKHEWKFGRTRNAAGECFHSFFKFSQIEYMFSISFRKHCNEKKENNLLTLIIKM